MHDSQLDTSTDDCIAPETISEIIEAYSTESPSALVLYLYLLARDLADEQSPSQQTLAEQTGICPATVREQLDTLQELALVEIHQDQRDRRYNIYESNAAKR
jgi:DNA-binding MarR family transcriptional regulator